MASEAQLRRRIRELQNEIHELNQRRENFRQEVILQTESRMREFEASYKQEILRNKQETDAAYAARLREFQENTLRESSEIILNLEEQMQRINQEQAKKIDELDSCNRELKTAFEEMKNNYEREQQLFQTKAEEAYENVLLARDTLSKQPHEFFCEDQFEVISQQVSSIEQDIKAGMYQSAAADANGLVLDYNLLRVKVIEAFEAWKRTYNQYCQIVLGLHLQLESLKESRLITSAGSFVLNTQEMNFWSVGEFEKIAAKIQEAYEQILFVDKKGLITYLKQQKDRKKDDIFFMLSEVKQWCDNLTAVINCINSERIFSDERWYLAGEIGDVFFDHGYEILRDSFRMPSKQELCASWYIQSEGFRKENPMDCYDLKVTLQGLDVINICLVPVRNHGLTVRNECLITVDMQTIVETETINQIVKITEDRIHQTSIGQNIGIRFIPDSKNRVEKVRLEESSRKKQPSPIEQMKMLEKKYH